MGKRAKILKITGGLAAVLLLLLGICRISVYAGTQTDTRQENGKTLRIVVPETEAAGYLEEKDGEYTGYFAEYMEEISEYTGWQYKFSTVDAFEGLRKLLKDGNFDLMLGIPYSVQREEYYSYSKHSMGSSQLVVATLKDSLQLNADGLDCLRGLRIAVSDTENNHNLEEYIKSFCFANGIDYVDDAEEDFEQGINFIHVTEEERFKGLQERKYDAVLASDSVALENNLYILASFGSHSLYATAPKGNTEYLEQLDKAMEAIWIQDEGYEQRLYDKYFSANKEKELVFSQEELEYLEQEHTFTVGLYDYCAPYCYRNEAGEWCGVAVKLYEKIEEQTKGRLHFTFKGYPNLESLIDEVKAGKCDIIGVSFSNMQLAKGVGGTQSRVYFTDTFCVYSNYRSTKPLAEADVVLKKNFPQSMWQEAGISAENLESAANVEEALKQVDDGKADATIALQNVADYYINYDQLRNLDETDSILPPVSCCSIFGGHMDEMAVKAINRCISYQNTDWLEECIHEYILLDHREVGMMDYIKAHKEKFAVMLIAVLAVIIAMLIGVVIIIYKKTNRIYQMLYQDDITDGISYLKFHQEAEKLLQSSEGPLYFLFVDISNFKYINDAYDYDTGNRVLQAVNDFLVEQADEYPCARIYSDHFAVLNEFRDKEDARNQLEADLQQFRRFCKKHFQDFNVFLKIGVYEWTPGDEADIQKAINLANYAADSLHNSSKSQIAFYTEEMHEGVLKQQEIEKDMHRAMDDGEFVAFYQPKVDIETGSIIGAEALVRWKHREKGLISPGLFVPVFEQNRFIIEVDFCVFEQVCALQARRHAAGEELCPISCNFSRLHLLQDNFVERLLQISQKYQVPAKYLEIEITETVATDDFGIFIDKIKKIKENGFLISIDDFGNGYSCIQLLYKMPIDVLKFDRVFVTSQDSSLIEQEMNRSIVHICHENHIRIICEGVETRQQQEFVRSYGCRYVQGFLYSRPVDEASFEEMLNRKILPSREA